MYFESNARKEYSGKRVQNDRGDLEKAMAEGSKILEEHSDDYFPSSHT